MIETLAILPLTNILMRYPLQIVEHSIKLTVSSCYIFLFLVYLSSLKQYLVLQVFILSFFFIPFPLAVLNHINYCEFMKML